MRFSNVFVFKGNDFCAYQNFSWEIVKIKREKQKEDVDQEKATKKTKLSLRFAFNLLTFVYDI